MNALNLDDTSRNNLFLIDNTAPVAPWAPMNSAGRIVI